MSALSENNSLASRDLSEDASRDVKEQQNNSATEQSDISNMNEEDGNKDADMSFEVVGEEESTSEENEFDGEEREILGADDPGSSVDTEEGSGMINKSTPDDHHQTDNDEANTGEEQLCNADKVLDFSTNPEEMDTDDRMKLYTLGQALQERGNNVHALKCFLRCLSGLNGKQNFAHMSECLRKVAEIYYTMEEYEKAVQFIQAEKVYYESALMESPEAQKQLGLLTTEEGSMTEDQTGSPESYLDQYNKTDVIRAQEYDSLAQLCLDHQQAEMALEYQGKATKLRQKLLGNEHPVTKKSLDRFTLLYGEAGKHQYEESMTKLLKSHVEDESDEPPKLRQRMTSSGQNEEISTPDVNCPEAHSQEDEPVVIPRLLVMLFIMCLIALICSGCYIYCRIDRGSHTCSNWKQMIEHSIWKIQYWLYKMTALPADN